MFLADPVEAATHARELGGPRRIAVGVEEDGYLIGISLMDPAIQRAVFESPGDKDSIVALFEKHGKKYAPIS